MTVNPFNSPCPLTPETSHAKKALFDQGGIPECKRLEVDSDDAAAKTARVSSAPLSPVSQKRAFPEEEDQYATPLKKRAVSVPEKGARTYPVTVSPESGKIRMHATPSSKKKCGKYEISDGEMVYVGKTSQPFQKRLSQHASCANDETETAPLYQALREKPTDFHFTLIEETPPDMPAPEQTSLEIEGIQQIPKKRRLNANRGGGGGTSRSTATSSHDPNASPELFSTPLKYVPIEKKGEKATLAMTPTSGNEEGTVYVFKNQVTDERYIGETSQPLKARMSQHLSRVNNPKKRFRSRLYEAMRENPEQFAVGILAKKVPAKQLAETEKHYIKEKQSIEHGFNENAGGGGSSKST